MKKLIIITLTFSCFYSNQTYAQGLKGRLRKSKIKKSFKKITSYKDTLFYKGKAVAIEKEIVKNISSKIFNLNEEELMTFNLVTPTPKGLMLPKANHWVNFKGLEGDFRITSKKWNREFIKNLIDNKIFANNNLNITELNKIVAPFKKERIDLKVSGLCLKYYVHIYISQKSKKDWIEVYKATDTYSSQKITFGIGDKVLSALIYSDGTKKVLGEVIIDKKTREISCDCYNLTSY